VLEARILNSLLNNLGFLVVARNGPGTVDSSLADANLLVVDGARVARRVNSSLDLSLFLVEGLRSAAVLAFDVIDCVVVRLLVVVVVNFDVRLRVDARRSSRSGFYISILRRQRR
jgi:hypothetical protein